MKRLPLTLFFYLLYGALSAAFAQLSIDSCQSLARQNYPLIKRYDLIEQSKKYNLSNAAKSYLPQVSLNIKASYQSEVTSLPIPIQGLDMKGLTKDQYMATVDISQSIWDGGITGARKELIKAGAEVEQQQVEVELYTLNGRINQLFFGILLLDAQLEQNKLLQNDLQRTYNNTQSYMANGLANQADLDAVEVEQLKAKQYQVSIQSDRKAYLEMLSAMLNKPLDSSTQLLEPEMEAPAHSGQINRPEIKLFRSQFDLLEAQQSSISSGYMPRFSLFLQGGYGKPGLNMMDGSFSPFYIGGVRLNWNFGALYTQKTDRRKIVVDQAGVQAQMETFLYNTNLQIKQQDNQIQKLNNIIVYDDDIISLRTRVRQAAEAKAANGTITVVELMREVNTENLAKQDKIAHEIELMLAIRQLNTTIDPSDHFPNCQR